MAQDNPKGPDATLERLERLAARPPQVLLLEGGNEKSRLAAALHWVRTINCPTAIAARKESGIASPCGTCPACAQITAMEHGDLYIYDGRIANRQDDENPGLIRALRMERMRELKALNAEAPRFAARRIAVFQGLSQTREEAMNSLLKTLEEPSKFTLFVILTPQRAQILPTLVSRSFCMTLPWPGAEAEYEEIHEWNDALAVFFLNGSCFLEKAGAKNALNATLAMQILSAFQASLLRVCTGQPARQAIDKSLAPVRNQPAICFQLGGWIDEAQSMLACTVNPARVMEAFASKVFCLLKTL